jgi:hypothetical protein
MAKDKLDLVIDRIEDVKEAVDNVQDHVNKINLNVARNTDSLDHHIRRTDLLEKHVKIIEDRLSISYLLKLSISVATGLGAIAGAVYSVVKVLSLL